MGKCRISSCIHRSGLSSLFFFLSREIRMSYALDARPREWESDENVRKYALERDNDEKFVLFWRHKLSLHTFIIAASRLRCLGDAFCLCQAKQRSLELKSLPVNARKCWNERHEIRSEPPRTMIKTFFWNFSFFLFIRCNSIFRGEPKSTSITTLSSLLPTLVFSHTGVYRCDWCLREHNDKIKSILWSTKAH